MPRMFQGESGETETRCLAFLFHMESVIEAVLEGGCRVSLGLGFRVSIAVQVLFKLGRIVQSLAVQV